MPEENVLMVSVSGPDEPGILSSFTEILERHGIGIVDIQQASLQKTIGLHLLLDLADMPQSRDGAIKDLLFAGHQRGLTLNLQWIGAGQRQDMDRGKRFVFTCFGGTSAVARLSKVLAEENANIEMISTQAHHGARSLEMVVNTAGVENVNHLKNRMMAKSRELGVDLAVQTVIAHRKNKRMVCFDMDSTLVDMEGIDEMARRAGVHREVARITEKAMRGDLDFEESLRQRVAMLGGLALDEVVAIKERMVLSHGVENLLTTLKWLGFRLGIVSGGFDIFADALKQRFNLDFAFANRLGVKNGALTGRLEGEIVDAASKARIVNRVACDMGIPLDQIVAVGDGANDSLMLAQAGLGIAYNAKMGLDRAANAALSKARFNHIFHLLGITEEDINEAIHCKVR